MITLNQERLDRGDEDVAGEPLPTVPLVTWAHNGVPRFSVVHSRESAEWRYKRYHLLHDEMKKMGKDDLKNHSSDFAKYISNTQKLLDRQTELNSELKGNLDTHTNLLERQGDALVNTNQGVKKIRRMAQEHTTS